MLLVFYFLNQLFQFLKTYLLVLNEGRHGTHIRFAKKLINYIGKRSATIFITAYQGEILETAGGQGTMAKKALLTSSLFVAIKRRTLKISQLIILNG